MSIADKLQTILENEQKVYNAGYEKGKSEGGGSGEKPTLFTPSISLQPVTSVLTITDSRNGDFAQGYNIYANDDFITVSTSKEVTLSDYIEHTETLQIKVQTVGANFNPSDYAVITWQYVNVDGTAGISYSLSSDGTYAICNGIGDAVETDIKIASEYKGVPVSQINRTAFNAKNITSVLIPDSVTKIGEDAFSGCKVLTSVSLLCQNVNIVRRAFSYCSQLVNVNFSDWTIIEWFNEETFAGCAFATITIPSSVRFFYKQVFYNCKNLKRVDLSKHTSVPSLVYTDVFSNTHTDLQIKVPANLIDEWKSATNWANYASKIVTEFTNTL